MKAKRDAQIGREIRAKTYRNPTSVPCFLVQ